ncbi:MAG: four helix bundle protein [Deltaproteobacteria bacterium]|nr:four helix bundle protein [Deltaproteobacteria bacterium]
MGKGGFKELKVWQKSKDFAVYIYRITNIGSFTKDYSLRDQIRRAAVSIPSNIAEGDERQSNKESIRFFYIAKGSSAEVLTQATIAFEIGYIDNGIFKEIEKRWTEISGMLSNLPPLALCPLCL